MFDEDVVKAQVIGLLNLAPRDDTGVPEYLSSVTGGDTIYSQGEIDRAVRNALVTIMQTICETDGHPDRALYVVEEDLNHGELMPTHYGSIGLPKIRPFMGAPYYLSGKRKTVEQVQAYRANRNSYYTETDHDQEGAGGMPSKLAGYYAIDEAAQVFYFTGYQAESDLAYFTEADFIHLPHTYYQLATSLAITNLNKDGNISDVFASHAQVAALGLQQISSQESDQPSPRKTVGMRESGTV